MSETRTKIRTGKGGRPRINADEKLSMRFNTRLSARTHQSLIEKADAAHMSEHDLVRALIDGLEIRSPHRGKNPELVEAVRALQRELNAIGNNINQLALSANRGRDMPHYWQEVGDQLRGVLDGVLDRIDA